MLSSWRSKRKSRRIAAEITELTLPNHFRCPISLDLMKDPVTLSTGITYDRESIETWIEAGNFTCPTTNQELGNLDLIPNHTLRKMIQDWCVEKRSFGVERIPTPRIPINSVQILEIQSKITRAYKRDDQLTCEELVKKIKNLAKENERNKRCIVENGTGMVLACAFEAFSVSFDKNSSVLEEILSCLTWVIDGETKSYLGLSISSMHCIVWFMSYENLSTRTNAVSVLKDVSYHDQTMIYDLNKIEGVEDALVKLIREPICATTTRTSLTVIFHMVSSCLDTEKVIRKFLEIGLVSVLIELLVDSDKHVCENALSVLNEMCSITQGREKAYENALTIPVLVKKILRVSELATELSVSVLSTLCTSVEQNGGRSGVLMEALQVGAFQKVLVVLQVGCGKTTKEKATELLKLLNGYRGSVECVDSMDFKNIKRSY